MPFTFGPASPGSDLMPAPQPQPAPQPAPQPQQAQQAYKPGILDILQGMFFDGLSPAESGQHARDVYYQNQRNEILQHVLQTASPEEQKAMLFNAPELGKAYSDRFATHTLSGGQTLDGGQGGPSRTAPVVGFDPTSGNGYSVTPDAMRTMPGNMPGAQSIDSASGAVLDNRRGPTGAFVPLPLKVEPGTTLNSYQGGGVAGAPGAPSAPQGGGTGPRGIRNNNFGNVKALPGNQAWNGQVGVDDQGHAIFASPADGIKAAQQNLTAYATKHGINTVAGVVDQWASGATPQVKQNYAAYLAGTLHVDPSQQIDLTDPKVQRPLLKGIFGFENGPQTMGSWRSPSAPSSPQVKVLAQGAQPRTLSPQEAQAAGYAPGTVVEEDAAHHRSVSQAPQYDASWAAGQRKQVLDSDEYKQYQAANAAWHAMVNSAAQPNGGIRAYAMRDTFARLINPGAVARVGTIEALKQSQGVPANVQAYLMNLKGDGDVPPQIAQQIMDVAHGFLQAHHEAARTLNDSNATNATSHQVPVADATAPMDPMPDRFSIAAAQHGIPQPSQRKQGQVYQTPRGAMKWTGTGWIPAGGR